MKVYRQWRFIGPRFRRKDLKSLVGIGSLTFKEAFLKDSSRTIILEGEKAEKKRVSGKKA